MPCEQGHGGPHATESDCLKACADGACCEADGSCNIKRQCECDTENGAVFAGVGETCEACQPCGCSDEQQLDLLHGTVINLSFSGFAPTRRFGTSRQGAGCDCDAQYGFGGADIMLAEDFLNDWVAHFNSITVQLTVKSVTPKGVTWSGDSGEIQKPDGGTAIYFYEAALSCNGYLGVGHDTSQGCQQNSGFTEPTASFTTSAPMAFAPMSYLTGPDPGASVVYECGGLVLRSQYILSNLNTQVFCAAVEESGCYGSADCGSSYFRAGFSGNGLAVLSNNPLP